MSDTGSEPHRRNIIRAVRAIALPNDELRKLTPSFLSPERMAVDDYDDAIAIARDIEARGQTVFPGEVWDELSELSRLVKEMTRRIYSGVAGDERAEEAAWTQTRAEARRVLAALGWDGAVDPRHHS